MIKTITFLPLPTDPRHVRRVNDRRALFLLKVLMTGIWLGVVIAIVEAALC